jgi:hypothetical protein
MQAVRAILEEFGRAQSPTGGKRIFSVKTSEVVAVEIDGVKTVRVVP